MKNRKAVENKKKEVRTKLNSKLVKKFGFEQKFLIKEVLDSVLNSAKPHEFFPLRILGLRSEGLIKKRLLAKQGSISKKKKLNFLNGKCLFSNPRNAENE